ncbi:MAG: gliding motility lipoprotein GldD [Cyclobacteriaceae bacterium]|nr:gliding motility lipoprotein GldD [Cyclobacteriaceae bacterium]
MNNWSKGIALVYMLAIWGCHQEYTPKPKGFNRLDLPVATYQNLPDTLPYSFEYSSHAHLLKDTSSISEKYWVEVYYPALLADIHITYIALEHDQEKLEELFKDSYFLTSKHNVKAYSIDDVIMKTFSGKTVSVAELYGDVPSQFQFVCTDSINNFMRGALYFNTKVQNDSLAPAIEYVKKDIIHLLNTLEWKE